MATKEEAKELVDKFKNWVRESDECNETSRLDHQKQCALICVDSMMWMGLCDDCENDWNYYLQEVKQEINKL